MTEPQDTQETVERDGDTATLRDEDIETRRLDSRARASASDTGDDSGDTSDTGDDSGDTSDTSDTGDDSGDSGDDSGTGS